MKVSIKIECETGAELVSHLEMLKIQVKKAIKIAKKTGIVKKPIKLFDDNCYGTHEANIREFSGDELMS
jgi:hypothetical protein